MTTTTGLLASGHRLMDDLAAGDVYTRQPFTAWVIVHAIDATRPDYRFERGHASTVRQAWRVGARRVVFCNSSLSGDVYSVLKWKSSRARDRAWDRMLTHGTVRALTVVGAFIDPALIRD